MQKHQLDEQVSLDKVGDFNGSIYLYSFKGQEDLSKWYEHGTNSRNKLIAPPCLSNCGDNHGDGPNAGGDGGGRIILYTDHYTDWYKFEDGDWKFTHTVFSHRTEQVLFENNRSFNYYRGHKEYTPTQGGTRNGGRVIGKVDAEKEAIRRIDERKSEPLPPSCKSFRYQQWLDNQQICATKNIRFKVKVIGANNVRETLNFEIEQPVYFLTPRFYNTHGNLTTGQGANLTADAIRATTNFMFALHLATGVSESQIRERFLIELDKSMKERMGFNSAAASIHGFSNMPANIPVTRYQTVFLGKDNCR